MGRITIIALALAACGGSQAKDFEVQSEVVAGTDAPPASTFDNGSLIGPITSEPAHVKGMNLTSATLRSEDGSDLSYLQSVEILAADAPAPFVVASLQSPPAAGATRVQLQLSGETDLTGHLKSGGRLDAVFTYATAPAAPHPLRLTLRLHGAGIGSPGGDDSDTTVLGAVPPSPDPDPDTTDPGPPPPDDDPGDGDCCDLHTPRKPIARQNAAGPKR